jgi:hypothetical protein
MASIADVFFEGLRYTSFRDFGYVLMEAVHLERRILLGVVWWYFAPCTHWTGLHNREFQEFVGGNSVSRLGLSFQQMHEGICICFRLIQPAQSFVLFCVWYSSCFEVKYGSIPFLSGVLIFLWDHQDCHVISFATGVLLFKLIRSFQHLQDQFSFFLNDVRFDHPKLSLFFPPSHPFFSSWS